MTETTARFAAADAARHLDDSRQAARHYRVAAEWTSGRVDPGAVAKLEPMSAESDINIQNEYQLVGLHALAWVYRETGRDEEAHRILGAIDRDFASLQAQDLLHRSDDLFSYAQNALLLGNHDTALDRLERAVDAGWRKYLIQRHDPRWAPLHNHPRYVSLMQLVMADVERQRAEVERIDATDDFMSRFEAARRLRP